MSAKNASFKIGAVGFVLGVACLGTLTGCTNDGDRASLWHPFAARPKVPIQDAYVYYPDHDVYYNGTRRNYMYVENGGWVTDLTPPSRVSVEVLRASPAVKLKPNDFPEHHHAVMEVRK